MELRMSDFSNSPFEAKMRLRYSRSRHLPYRVILEQLEARIQLSANSFGFSGLGAAGEFAVLGINGGRVTLNSSHIVGDIGLAAGETSVLQKTDDLGTLRV